MGKKTVRGHDIANRFVYSLTGLSFGQPGFFIFNFVSDWSHSVVNYPTLFAGPLH